MPESLHPDFPPTEKTGRYPEYPDPLYDINTALETSGKGIGIEDLASVDLYDITSDHGKWAPGGSVATELSMTLLGTLKDGRWFGLEAGNDYTGWGCQDFADLYIGGTREDVILNGLTTEGRNTLGLSDAGGRVEP